MKIKSVKPAGIQNVYDIGVPQYHNFVLANGAVASNCFNKSHSIAYSYITYTCAWLKANYPLEFFCALMGSRSQTLTPALWAAKATEYTTEAELLGIKINPPSINHSGIGFKIINEEIYFGFNAIRDIGKTAANSIILARGKTGFKDILDFLLKVDRTKVTKRVFQSLVKSGAFDKMGYKRSELIDATDILYDYWSDLETYLLKEEAFKAWEVENELNEALIEERNSLRQQQHQSQLKRNPGPPLTEEQTERLIELNNLNLRKKTIPKNIDDPRLNTPNLPRYSQITLSISEIIEQADCIGCFIGKHPAHIIYPNTSKIANCEYNSYIETAGYINSVKVIKTRRGDPMAFLSISDETSIAEIIVFPNVYTKLMEENNLPAVGDIIWIKGKCEAIDPTIKLIANAIDIYKR